MDWIIKWRLNNVPNSDCTQSITKIVQIVTLMHVLNFIYADKVIKLDKVYQA